MASCEEPSMHTSVRRFFERYERSFNRALAGGMSMDELSELYAPSFIAASPAGVLAGKNDDGLRQAMAQGYAHYRAIGTKAMRIHGVRIHAIDEHHCLAHVSWQASYARGSRPDVVIDFEVHYFVQQLDDEPKVFGWVSGDEQALLHEHGIL